MSATAELELKLPAPAYSPEEVAALVAVLREAGGWLTAKECAARLGEDWSDREVRALASVACQQVVSFPGSKGYKLWALCTVAEIGRCIAAFEGQGRDMFKRALVYRQAYHRRFRGAPE